jgi:hypothetical protein
LRGRRTGIDGTGGFPPRDMESARGGSRVRIRKGRGGTGFSAKRNTAPASAARGRVGRGRRKPGKKHSRKNGKTRKVAERRGKRNFGKQAGKRESVGKRQGRTSSNVRGRYRESRGRFPPKGRFDRFGFGKAGGIRGRFRSIGTNSMARGRGGEEGRARRASGAIAGVGRKRFSGMPDGKRRIGRGGASRKAKRSRGKNFFASADWREVAVPEGERPRGGPREGNDSSPQNHPFPGRGDRRSDI